VVSEASNGGYGRDDIEQSCSEVKKQTMFWQFFLPEIRTLTGFWLWSDRRIEKQALLCLSV